MLRLMLVNRTVRLAMVLIATMTASCGWHALPGAHGDSAIHRQLLAAADAAVARTDGEAKVVEAVQTTRGKMRGLAGYSDEHPDEVVWVLQVSGDEYVCGGCSAPFNAALPKGRYITEVLRASDLSVTEFGLGPTGAALSRLGKVERLRDRSRAARGS
jgi:hypothetical protein